MNGAISCQFCGFEFPLKPSALARGRGRFCSRSCYTAARFGVEVRPAAERFWEKVNKDGPIPEHRPELGPCWLWTGHINRQTGYGRFQDQRQSGTAHAWGYTHFVGPIPSKWDFDHLCRIHHCVNFEGHLDPVPHRVNVMRGEAPMVMLSRAGRCARGHAATDENVYRRKSTGAIVYCRLCRRARLRQASQRTERLFHAEAPEDARRQVS